MVQKLKNLLQGGSYVLCSFLIVNIKNLLGSVAYDSYKNSIDVGTLVTREVLWFFSVVGRKERYRRDFFFLAQLP